MPLFVLGSDDFREHIHSKLPSDPEISEVQRLGSAASLLTIIHTVTIVFATSEEEILHVTRGRGKKNIARSVGIYCCRKLAGLPLNEIAQHFGLSHFGSVSGLVTRVDRFIKENSEVRQIIRKVENIINK